MFLCNSSRDIRDLHSFPTRRSSDLRWSASATMLPLQKRAIVGAGNRGLARQPSGAVIRTGRKRPAFVGTGSCVRSEEHTSELQTRGHIVCRLLLEKKKHSVDVLKLR